LVRIDLYPRKRLTLASTTCTNAIKAFQNIRMGTKNEMATTESTTIGSTVIAAITK
jgi:hypothetical protein